MGREVALKVLPEEFTRDPERLARFEREAKLLAQLNHPNIAQIYALEKWGQLPVSAAASADSGVAKGKSETVPIFALAMELVEGPTLAERLEGGPFSFRESLSVALQIAQALEEAHEKGIVHRDLKPQNIKASTEGKVKVLDFGLAKAMEPVSPAGMSPHDLAHSPTVTFGGTREGVILGTAAYMSPEQARGGAVDKRADIWAFGVVLYEMLTGERLFAEGSVVDTLSAVLRQEIDLGRLPAGLPPRVRELVRRCLERDPKRRLRDIGEARIVLVEAEAGGEEAVAPAAGATAARRSISPTLAGAAALLWALVGYLFGQRAAPAPNARVEAGSPSFVRLTSRPGLEVQPALSPDGKTLYFSARHAERDDLDIWFTPAGGKRPIDLTADCSEDDGYPAVSPDGRQIAFRSERDDGGIFRMGTTGQSVRRLTGGCFDPAWSPDGSRIACTTCPGRDPFNRTCRGELRVVDVASGTERTIELEDAAAPSWSADGRRLAFWGLSASGAQRDLWTVALDGAAPVALTDDPAVDWNPIWSADGASLAFLSDRSGAPGLWKLAVDVASGPVLGEPRSLVLPTEFADGVRISGGRLVYASRALRASVARHVFDPERLEIVGTPRTVVEVTGRMQSASVPPEGRTVAFTSYFPQQDLYVVGNDGGAPVQLTDDRAFDRFPIWDPNGERIHFMSNRGGPYETWAIRPDGSGLEQLTRTGDDSGWIPLLSPDRAQLVTSTFRGPRVFDARGPAPWTTFDRLADGEIGIHPRLDVEGIGVAWLPDGRRLLVNNGEGGMRTLDIATGAVRPVAGGERFAESRGAFSADLPTIVDFRNVQEADIWLAEGIE